MEAIDRMGWRGLFGLGVALAPLGVSVGAEGADGDTLRQLTRAIDAYRTMSLLLLIVAGGLLCWFVAGRLAAGRSAPRSGRGNPQPDPAAGADSGRMGRPGKDRALAWKAARVGCTGAAVLGLLMAGADKSGTSWIGLTLVGVGLVGGAFARYAETGGRRGTRRG